MPSSVPRHVPILKVVVTDIVNDTINVVEPILPIVLDTKEDLQETIVFQNIQAYVIHSCVSS